MAGLVCWLVGWLVFWDGVVGRVSWFGRLVGCLNLWVVGWLVVGLTAVFGLSVASEVGSKGKVGLSLMDYLLHIILFRLCQPNQPANQPTNQPTNQPS